MARLQQPHAGFTAKKAKILEQLAVPDADYSDASPKGSVDAGIRDLIDEINAQDGLVTTSSCAGRVSVFVEGRKATAPVGEGGGGEKAASAVGGKGGGGVWLFVSHDPVDEGLLEDDDKLVETLGLSGGGGVLDAGEGGERLIHFKFEPMILHILTASPQHAQAVLKCGLQAGFRESGAVSLTNSSSETAPATPMVAIRSMGLSFESLVGMADGSGRGKAIVSTDYLRMLVRIGNERFVENQKRIARFLEALRAEIAEQKKETGEGGKTEKELRRERKMAEGLRRQAEKKRDQEAADQESERKREREAEIVEDYVHRVEAEGLF